MCANIEIDSWYQFRIGGSETMRKQTKELLSKHAANTVRRIGINCRSLTSDGVVCLKLCTVHTAKIKGHTRSRVPDIANYEQQGNEYIAHLIITPTTMRLLYKINSLQASK